MFGGILPFDENHKRIDCPDHFPRPYSVLEHVERQMYRASLSDNSIIYFRLETPVYVRYRVFCVLLDQEFPVKTPSLDNRG